MSTPGNDPRVPPRDDPYARGSFTLRRMKSWQVTALVVIFVLLVLAAFFWF